MMSNFIAMPKASPLKSEAAWRLLARTTPLGIFA
jgi:hypothetical protein